MEGPQTKNEESRAYKYTLNSLREEVLGILNEEGGQNKYYRQNDYAATLMEPVARIRMLAPATTRDQNQSIVDFINELTNKQEVSGDLLFALANFLNINLYSREELIDIVNSTHSYSFIHGLLKFGGGEVIFKDMTNKEIRDFCTGIIKKFSKKSETDEESRNQYAFFSAHRGYDMWDSAENFIKLDNDLNKTIEEGTILGDEFIWEKILKERVDVIKKLPKERRMEIAKTIFNSIQAKRGFPITDLPSVSNIDAIERVGGFGRQLGHRIQDIFYSGE
jgi:hypothetical protein